MADRLLRFVAGASSWALVLGLLCLAVAPAEGQVGDVPPPDDPDAAVLDSIIGSLPPGALEAIRGDSLAADTVPLDSILASLPPDALEAILADSVSADSMFAGNPLDAAADSVVRALRALPGFTVTEYQGDRATYTTGTGLLRLEGSAGVRRDDQELTADTILYRERSELVEAFGSPRVSGNNQILEGRELYYDLERRRATALGARTQIVQEATWYVTGDMTAEGTSRLFGSHAQFTSCDLAIPHYHFEADQVVVIRDKIIVARPARLYFGDVPVMVLPFVVQNLEQGRRSGLLTPRFGVNDVFRTSSGYNRQISDLGFYWAINEYAGAQLSTTWRSGAYTALFGNLDFNWRRQFLNGRIGAERYWRVDGPNQFGLNANTSWRPDERTNLAVRGRYVTDEQFVRDASVDPREVTQDLNSSLSVNRRFDWGQLSLGADRRQSIASGDVTMTLPSFSINRNAITLVRGSDGGLGNLLGDVTFNPGSLTGSRSTTDYEINANGRQDADQTQFRVGPTLSVGNLTLSTSGDLNRKQLGEAQRTNDGQIVIVPASDRDIANVSGSMSYQQQLIGSTNISPVVSINQSIVRDSLTSGRYIQAPSRVNFGANLNTDLFGFFPGVGGYSAIRHHLAPRLSYRYAPEVQQSALQERVFGPAGGRAQNRVTLGLSQTFEAKLRRPRAEEPRAPADTIAGDTVSQIQAPQVPADPEKVTLLSINTSAFEYDFVQAREEGTGFVTTTVSNTIQSDYLRGLSINMQHELFDRRNVDPTNPANSGKLGNFAPRLTSLSTGFQLGPQSSIFQWLERFGFGGGNVEDEEDAGILPGPVESDDPVPNGQGAFTGNPRDTGDGPWTASLRYQFSRPLRNFTTLDEVDDDATQTVDGSFGFQLSPNWAVNWNTSYSLSDGEFGSHRINFQRDLHEWQANFNFYQTPNGNTAFEFYVELRNNQELRFDYSEQNLGVDRPR